ncbi:MAG: cytochrome c biogenesis protein ResB [Propionibacteriaceae bacterium]|jgi:cytochrome c biogenesis protein|nr:cytochrome c biogenesis protein ResB [Propionibacteriaceae bacterium]
MTVDIRDSQDEAAPGLAAAEPGAGPGPDEEPDAAPGEFFRRIYQFFYSKTLGVVTILALAVYVLLGALLVQAGAGVYGDAAAEASFVESVRAKYGGLTGVLNALGLFHIFSSVGFLVVIGVLALSILACTTHRLPLLWDRFRHPKTHPTDEFFGRARYRAELSVTDSPDVAATAVADHLKRLRYRVLADPDDPRSLYADKFAWGGFGTVAAHVSFLIIIAAFALSALAGVAEVTNLPVGGAPVAVGHGTDLQVQATTFQATYDDDGRPLDYVSHLVVTENGAVVKEQDVRVNEPLSYGGFKFHQNSYGLAADVQVTGPDGSVVFDQSVPLEYQTSDGTAVAGIFTLAGPGLEVQVILPASGSTDSGIAAGDAVFQLYKTGSSEVLDMAEVAPGEVLDEGDYDLTFLRERQVTGILVRHDPGAPWMIVGSILLVAGMTVTFACRHRRYWVRVAGAGPAGGAVLRLASSDKEDGGFRQAFEDLAADLGRVFAPTAEPAEPAEPATEPAPASKETTHA